MENPETISLPNNDNGSVVSDRESTASATVLVVRLTPDGAYTAEDLKKFLEEQIHPYDQWVVGVETVPKLHYHLVINTIEPYEEVKELIKSQINLWYPPPRARGFGNKQWNCQKGKKGLETAISYALKDKEDKFFFGFSEEYINECIEASFPKSSPSNFRVEYLELCEQFQTTQMDIRTFMIKYSILKSKYNQQVRMHDAYGYALSNLIRRDNSEAESYVENYLYKL